MNEEPIRDPKVINDLFDDYNNQKYNNGTYYNKKCFNDYLIYIM